MRRLRFRAKKSPSRLGERFLFLWQIANGPPLELEFRFHAERRWRAGFACLPSRELFIAHWREAKDSADEDGKFAIGLRISVTDGAPAQLKLKCSISKTITDELESQVDDPEQMKLL